MELTLFFLAVAISSCIWKTAAQGDSTTCQVEYTRQPPDQLQCNPYINAELRLECRVTTPPNQRATLVWYRRRFLQTQQSQESSHSRSKRSERLIVERLTSSMLGVDVAHLFSSSSTSFAARSRLLIVNLDSSDSGEYYCVAQIAGIEASVPSDAVVLREPTFYSNMGLSACATSVRLSKEERKCADSATTVTTASSSSSSSVSDIGSQPATTPTAKDISTSSSSAAKPPTTTVSKPAPSGGSSDNGNTGVQATTSDPGQVENTDDSTGSVPAEDELIGDSSTDDSKTNDDLSVLLELYIAISILVVFGVIIMALIPITVWMCLKKKKTQLAEGVRRSRQNLEFGSTQCGTSALQSPSTASQVASDYLVPLPSWRSHKQKVQPSDYTKPTSFQQSYEMGLSCSHEYEELRDVIEESGTQIDGYMNESPTFVVLQVYSPPAGGEYISGDVPVRMKRNAAYRMYSTVNGDENLRRNVHCNEVTVSNPLNCLYTAQHSINEQQSNLE